MTYAQLHQLDRHSEFVTRLLYSPDESVSLSPDGSKIISGSRDSVIRIWDAVTGVQLRQLDGHSSSVYSASYSPDGSKILSGSTDRTIRIWDSLTGEELHRFHAYSRTPVSYSPDGSKIVSGSSNGSIQIWDAITST